MNEYEIYNLESGYLITIDDEVTHYDFYDVPKQIVNIIKQLEQENKELHNKIDKLTNNLENSIESINVKLGDKEIRIKDGRIVNPIGEFRSVRLKAIRMKCKELLEILKDSDVNDK